MGNAVITKTVNIKANIPVRNVTPPIYGVRLNVKMTLSDILKCLCKRAIIEEVLPDGSTVRLTTKNFREDFVGQYNASIAKKKEEKKTPPNGSIDDIDLLSLIDKDDDDNDNGPQEPSNKITVKRFVDGTVIEDVGEDPIHVDPEDNGTNDFSIAKTDESSELSVDETTQEEQKNTVNTQNNNNINTKVVKKNSSKSKKKR